MMMEFQLMALVLLSLVMSANIVTYVVLMAWPWALKMVYMCGLWDSLSCIIKMMELL